MAIRRLLQYLVALALAVLVIIVVSITHIHNRGQAVKYSNPYHDNICNGIGEPSSLNKDQEWLEFTSELQNYKRFHSAGVCQLRRMSANLKFQTTNGQDAATQVRTLLWSCQERTQCSGVGDQLRHVAFAFLLAVLSRRVFIVQWSKGDQTMQYLEPNEIDWTFFDEQLGMHKDHSDFSTNTTTSRRYKHSELARILHSNKQHVTITNGIGVSIVASYFGAFAEPTWMEELDQLGVAKLYRQDRTSAYVFTTGMILRYLFKFPNEVLKNLKRTLHSLRIHNRLYLATHIRTGFFGTNYQEELHRNKAFKNSSSWAQALQCSFKLSNEILGPNSPLLLVTDSHVVREWAVRMYGRRVRVTNITLYHNAIEASWSEVHTRTEFMGIWIDLLLMARAHVLVHGISGFSAMAGAFCSIPPHRQHTMPDCTPKHY